MITRTVTNLRQCSLKLQVLQNLVPQVRETGTCSRTNRVNPVHRFMNSFTVRGQSKKRMHNYYIFIHVKNQPHFYFFSYIVPFLEYLRLAVTYYLIFM